MPQGRLHDRQTHPVTRYDHPECLEAADISVLLGRSGHRNLVCPAVPRSRIAADFAGISGCAVSRLSEQFGLSALVGRPRVVGGYDQCQPQSCADDRQFHA